MTGSLCNTHIHTHNGGKKSEEFVKKVYVSEIEGRRRGRSVVRWKDRVNEYMHERGADKGEGLNKQGGRGDDLLPRPLP